MFMKNWSILDSHSSFILNYILFKLLLIKCSILNFTMIHLHCLISTCFPSNDQVCVLDQLKLFLKLVHQFHQKFLWSFLFIFSCCLPNPSQNAKKKHGVNAWGPGGQGMGRPIQRFWIFSSRQSRSKCLQWGECHLVGKHSNVWL